MAESDRGTGKWANENVPHRGWYCVGVEDLGEPTGICEMCELREIRFVHYMEHDKYPDRLGVGCVCAEHMEKDYTSPKKREATLRNAATRRKRWLSRQWRVSGAGNDFLNAAGYNLVIYRKGAGFTYRIVERETDNPFFSPRVYRTSDLAKLAAFDRLVFLQENGM
jgi:hypothetical protein